MSTTSLGSSPHNSYRRALRTCAAGVILSTVLALAPGVVPTATAVASPNAVSSSSSPMLAVSAQPEPMVVLTDKQPEPPEWLIKLLTPLANFLNQVADPGEAKPTMPVSELKPNVGLFFYHPEVGWYSTGKCHIDAIDESFITVYSPCPFDPSRRDVLVAQIVYDRLGRQSKLAFYRVGTAVSVQPHATLVRRVAGDPRLYMQAPPAKMPVIAKS